MPEDGVRRMALPKAGDILLSGRREGAEEPVDQIARAEHLLVRENRVAADTLDSRHFVFNLAGHVRRGVGVVLALRVYVRLKLQNCFHRGGPMIERDKIDAL